jgi:hypothetical protein
LFLSSKRFRRSLGTILLFTLIGQLACFAEPTESKLRVAIFRFDNAVGSSSYEAVCQALSTSLSLTVAQLGLYDIIGADSSAGTRDKESLRAWAASHNADYIMYGLVSQTTPGQVKCSLSIYDRAKGLSAITKESPSVEPLEVFDAADDIIASVLKAVTGRHIGFGSVNLINNGAKGDYSVSLDDIALDANATSISMVLNGKHSIVIRQKRMLGLYEVSRQTIEVAEGQSLDVLFSVPDLTEAERSRLESLEAAIKANWLRHGPTEDEDNRIAEYARLTADMSFSAAIGPYQKRAKQLSGEWSVLGDLLDIEKKAWDPDSELITPSIVAYLQAKNYPEPDRLRKAIRDNACLLATLLEFKAGEALSKGDYKTASDTFASILDFVAYLPEEWKAEFAYASSELDAFIDLPSDQRDAARMSAVFAELISASKRFYAIAANTARPDQLVIIPSDISSTLSWGTNSAAPGPQAVKLTGSVGAIRVSGSKVSQNLDLNGNAGILFVPNGFFPFGRPPKAEPTVVTQAFGRLVYSWLPEEGAKVKIDGKPILLAKADDGRIVSEDIVPGRHAVTVYVDPNEGSGANSLWLDPYEYRTTVVVNAGQNDQAKPVDFLLDTYNGWKKKITDKRGNPVAGVSLGLAGVSALSCVVCLSAGNAAGVHGNYTQENNLNIGGTVLLGSSLISLGSLIGSNATDAYFRKHALDQENGNARANPIGPVCISISAASLAIAGGDLWYMLDHQTSTPGVICFLVSAGIGLISGGAAIGSYAYGPGSLAPAQEATLASLNEQIEALGGTANVAK